MFHSTWSVFIEDHLITVPMLLGALTADGLQFYGGFSPSGKLVSSKKILKYLQVKVLRLTSLSACSALCCPPHQLGHTFKYSIHCTHQRKISTPIAVNIAHTITELVVGGGRKSGTPGSHRTASLPKDGCWGQDDGRYYTCELQLFIHRLDRPRLLCPVNNEHTKLVEQEHGFLKAQRIC